jgi:hypothetical protein
MSTRMPAIPAIAATLLASSASVMGATAGPSQDAEPFRWEGRLGGGRTIEIKGVSGSIEATAATGETITVVAHRRGRRDAPSSVAIEVVEHSGGVTICAVYPSRDGRNECLPGSAGRMSVQRNDVEVQFVVRVPAGVGFVGRTVNGDVSVDDLPDSAEGYSVNGSVRISSRGLVQAETVNGSIVAAMGRSDWADPREFRTVNGSITLDLPAGTTTRFRAETVNGSIGSDFPITLHGRVSPRRLHGIIGGASSSRELLVSTVNGDIRLRRGTR